MGDVIDKEAAIIAAQFARGVSSELLAVKQNITDGQRHLAPVELNKQGFISSLAGESQNATQDIAQIAIPDTFVDPTMQHDGKFQPPAPRPPYTTNAVPYQQPFQTQTSSTSDAMLNTIMLSLVSIEKQLALLFKAIKSPPTRKKTA